MKRKLFLSVVLSFLFFGIMGFSACEKAYDVSPTITPILYENMYKESIESIRKYNEEHDKDYLCFSGATTNALACHRWEGYKPTEVLREEFTFQNTACVWYVIIYSPGGFDFTLDITENWTYQETISACFPNCGESDIYYMTDENGYCVYSYSQFFEDKYSKTLIAYYLTTDTADRGIPLAILSYIL